MSFVLSILLMGKALATENFISVRRAFAPASYSHGEIESYSVGYGIRGQQLDYITSIKYTRNAQLGMMNVTLPHSLGPSIRFKVELVSYPKINLYLSEEIALLIDLGEGQMPFIIEQNLGFGMNYRVQHHPDNSIYVSSEIGVIPLMWAPYFSIDASVDF